MAQLNSVQTPLHVLAFVVEIVPVYEDPELTVVLNPVQDGAVGGTAVTVTVAEHVTEPPAPVAVPVYVVVLVGETLLEPLATDVTEPTP